MQTGKNCQPSQGTIQEHSSFSFEGSYSRELPQRTISNCLRLKTNQSIEGRSSIEMLRENKKYMKTQESHIDNDQHYRKLAQEQYDMRMESLIKQYELRLNKQEEYYELREWKLKEEIDNLTNQNMALTDELKRAKLASKNSQEKCTLCGDGQLLTHYNKILTESESHHKNCISEKKQLSQKIDETTAKYRTLDEQHDKVCHDMRVVSKQLKVCQKKVRELEEERDLALESVADLDGKWRRKFQKLECDSQELQRLMYQKQMEMQAQVTQSKLVEQSRQQNANSQQNSLKSSFMRPDRREDKQNVNRNSRNRKSIPKMMHISEDLCERKDADQNKDFFSKLRPYRHDPLRWKYF